eukprot:6189572-Pleurochrysis_carterae.AAC.2
MLSPAPSLCFSCNLAVFALAPLVYLARARPLRFRFSSSRAHGRRRRPLRPRPETARRRVQPLACDCSRYWYLLVNVLISTFPPARTVITAVGSLEIQICRSTPGSGVRGLKESVLTTDSDRARPLSGDS